MLPFCSACGEVAPNRLVEAAGLEASAGGAPAGVVEPIKLNAGFAGVAAPMAGLLFEGENKDGLAPAVLLNNPAGCELAALVVVGVEALLSLWGKSPLARAFGVVDEGVAAVVVGVVLVVPNKDPDELGLAPLPKMLELGVAAWGAPNRPPPPAVGVEVDDPDGPPNRGFCSVGLAPVPPNKVPPVFDDGVVLLLLLVFPKENPAGPVLVD